MTAVERIRVVSFMFYSPLPLNLIIEYLDYFDNLFDYDTEEKDYEEGEIW